MKPNATIYIVDDDEVYLNSMEEMLTVYDYNVFKSVNGLNIEEKIFNNKIDIILVDLKMPEIDGLQVLKKVRSYTDQVPVIMISGEGDVKNAVSALKFGAFDFIEKGSDVSIILATIEYAYKKRKHLLKANSTVSSKSNVPVMIAESKPMRAISAMIEKVNKTNLNVLITGESGTGKEVLAQNIHAKSNNKDSNFVAINCANLQETLLESELFGYKKGSFTGAYKDYPGKILEANNGTLFLDEIGEIPLNLQGKLLRVLQEKDFTPVGQTSPVNVNFRLICATNRNLQQMVKEGTFRNDLYYRINTVLLNIPCLTERCEDFKPLINHKLSLIANLSKRPGLCLTNDAINVITKYSWPGNIRELNNFIENLVVFCDNEIISADDIKIALQGPLLHHPLNSFI